jgi:hypothetical protein
LTAGSLSPRDHIATVVAAHGGLTHAVAESSRLLIAHGYGQYAAHLDHHRAELNVAIGELALWLESFGQWANVDVGRDVHPPATGQVPVRPESGCIKGCAYSRRGHCSGSIPAEMNQEPGVVSLWASTGMALSSGRAPSIRPVPTTTRATLATCCVLHADRAGGP